MKCEEYLQFLRSYSETETAFDFPYLTLRLPDVFGPFDDTNRYWSYLKWIQEYKKIDLQIVKGKL